MRKDHYRHGIGTELYTELLKRLTNGGFHRSVAMISLPNMASEKFHQKFGFDKIGVLSDAGFKFNKWVDVAVYELRMKS